MGQEELTEKEKYYLACLALNKHTFNIWQGFAPVIYNRDVKTVLIEAFGEESFNVFSPEEIELTKSSIKNNSTISVKLHDIFPESMQKKLKDLLLIEINKKIKLFSKSLSINSCEYIDKIVFYDKKIKFLPNTFSSGKYFYISLIFKNLQKLYFFINRNERCNIQK